MSLSQASVLNVANVSRDVQVSRKTVEARLSRDPLRTTYVPGVTILKRNTSCITAKRAPISRLISLSMEKVLYMPSKYHRSSESADSMEVNFSAFLNTCKSAC
jgi:hypothetical protein